MQEGRYATQVPVRMRVVGGGARGRVWVLSAGPDEGWWSGGRFGRRSETRTMRVC